MNYRHAYHAGNFADVLKHIVLTRIVEHLKGKEKAFRVIDTHAGAGLYDLSSAEAQKTGEWRSGIGRLRDAVLPQQAAELVAPYLQAVGPESTRYPGSPHLVRRLLRPQDRLTAIEKHPQDAAALAASFAGDWQVRAIELDGWLALGAHLPPKERRGLVLVDPPFEEAGEFRRLAESLAKAHRRWPRGIYALWYPVKYPGEVGGFREALARGGIPDIIDIRLSIRASSDVPALDGCGIAVVNPPWRLEQELAVLMPSLCGLLAESEGADWSVERLAPERLGA